MKSRSLTWSRLPATLVVAIGLQVAWFVLLTWTFAIVYPMLQSGNQYYETLGIALDGTPVISARSYTNYLDWSYRTLDGKSLPNQKDEDFLTAATMAGPIEPPMFYEYPVDWSMRVAGISDQQRTPTAWYIVRDEQPAGRCYLVGYDEKSKLNVGYIGRKGFRRTMPPLEDWFAVGRHTLTWGTGAVTSTTTIQPGALAVNYGESSATIDQRLPQWHLILIDGEKLLEVDLRERSLRTLYESQELVSVTTLNEPQPAISKDVAQTPTDADTVADQSPKIKQVARIALRTAEQIIVLDPPTGAQRRYTLPESVRGKAIQIYSPGDEQLVVQWGDNYYEPRLIWLKSDGAVAREEKVTIASYQGAGPEPTLVAVAAAPVPVGWTSVVFVIAPFGMLQTRQAATFAEAVARMLEPTWPALIGVVVIGAALATWAYRLQRKYHRTATGAWCAFVFLLGAPGFLAYWLEHRRPKLEACSECGQIVPRDRDECAACQRPFPAPPLVGTEIFA